MRSLKILIHSLLLFILLPLSWGCPVVNLTDQSKLKDRQALYEQQNNPGIRLAIAGMKDANKTYGLGTVNKAIQGYESKLCESFKQKGVSVKFEKTDFKGYYVKCSPMPGCLDTVEKIVREVRGPSFNEKSSLTINNARAKNYKEGYIRARALETYPHLKEPMARFINDELKAAYEQAKKAGPDFERKLSANIDLYRTQGINAVDKDLRRLVTALDTLLETPFAKASNIEEQLESALKGENAKTIGGFKVSRAMTGDDSFIIIRDDKNIQRVVGVDARGLGTTNMMTRFEELKDLFDNNSNINELDDVFKLSTTAMKKADDRMETSFKAFDKELDKELANATVDSLDESLAKARNGYMAIQGEKSQLMKMRFGSISNCEGGNSNVMNRITVIHNALKKLEANGVETSLPFTCLGVKYLLMLK